MPEDVLKQDQSAEGEVAEALGARIAELERLAAEKDGELQADQARLSEAEARLRQLEREVADRDNQLEALGQAMAESDRALAQAVSAHLTSVVRANPDVPDELITGDTIEAIDRSLENARSLISRVKQGLEAEASRTRVPAGAPQRMPPDLSALTPREKINYAIGGKR